LDPKRFTGMQRVSNQNHRFLLASIRSTMPDRLRRALEGRVSIIL
jgi:hypothetical protein